jgi:hypothetical protein
MNSEGTGNGEQEKPLFKSQGIEVRTPFFLCYGTSKNIFFMTLASNSELKFFILFPVPCSPFPFFCDIDMYTFYLLLISIAFPREVLE